MYVVPDETFFTWLSVLDKVLAAWTWACCWIGIVVQQQTVTREKMDVESDQRRRWVLVHMKDQDNAGIVRRGARAVHDAVEASESCRAKGL